ncbi:ABC transporter ATP-binding protein [Lacticaseibacillus nasuensis]|uniref:ABC transporter ATP-binding protein n=1 Tax=Lacticaseibacillus nasuensis TaxID=944671 RepID=UPI002247D104|nr:ABC transporter ATP-binding protein [Lacticaseibacillus nasuensis]MCX2455781.1 ABC transporter ATP-binding protein [Lacticaseibacillus nasuensis]
MLTTKGLGYWYANSEDYLFKDVNLHFDAGVMTAIVGQSGAGKTTMLSLLAGLDKPRAGTIAFRDEDIAKLGLTNYRRHHVSTIFQAYNLFTYMSARQNLLTAMAITQSAHRGDADYADQMLGKLGLTAAQMRQTVARLSGGQQQRVAIARSMVCDAELVVADEPTGNLDEANTQAVVDLFRQLAQDLGKAVIIVTHEEAVAAQCDAVLRLASRTVSWERQPSR